MTKTRKLRGRQTPDAAYVATIRANGGWMSSRDVATAHGHSWYVVSHALRRQSETGLLEEDVIEVVGAKRVREHSRVYRARPIAGGARRVETMLPGWLCPQAVMDVGTARQVKGVAGMSRWDCDDEDPAQPKGMPGAPEKGAAITKGSGWSEGSGSGREELLEAAIAFSRKSGA